MVSTLRILLVLITTASLPQVGLAQIQLSEGVTLRPSMQWYTIGSGQELSESRLNPLNSLRIEDRGAAIDLRPNIKLDSTAVQIVARPQIRGDATSAQVLRDAQSTKPDTRQDTKYDSTHRWLELYATWNVSDELILSYGMQNYQWGAAESLNPSNRIFHDTVSDRGLLTAIQGKRLFRMNLTWTKNASTIFMAEATEEWDAAKFREEETFEPKMLLKQEISWNSGTDYAGLVLGSVGSNQHWVGEYFNQTFFFDGFTLYGDASHRRGSDAWYPVREINPAIPGVETVQLKQSKTDQGVINTLGVAGLRYSFEGGSDVRGEYVMNTAGWSIDEQQLAFRAIDPRRTEQLPTIQTNARRWSKPGLEFRGQRYGLVSFRTPDLFTIKDLTLYLRTLRSFQDHSMSFYGSFEYAFGDASTFLLSGYGTKGDPDQELRGLIASSVLVGLRQDF